MDGMSPPPALFGVAPRAQALPPDNAPAGPPKCEKGLPDALRGALAGGLMFMPPAQRQQALSSVSALIERALKEHFAGFEDALDVPDAVKPVQDMYLANAMRALSGENPTAETVTSMVRAAYARHRGPKDALLNILAQMPQPSGQTRGPIQAEAAAQKAALLISVLSVFSSEEATPHFQQWPNIVGDALLALRTVFQGILGRLAQYGVDAVRDEVARAGMLARPAIVSAIQSQFRGRQRVNPEDLVHAIRECLYDASQVSGGLAKPPQAQMHLNEATPPTGNRGQADPAPPYEAPQTRSRPQVGNVCHEHSARQRQAAPPQGGQSDPQQMPVAPVGNVPMGVPAPAPLGRGSGAFGGFGR